jgi:hypothetical protein
MMETVDPDWAQTVVYKDIHPDLMKSCYLEFTVWDYDKFGQNLFLGQVILSLAGESLWRNRATHDRVYVHRRDSSKRSTYAIPPPTAQWCECADECARDSTDSQ